MLNNKTIDDYTTWLKAYPWEIFMTIRLPQNMPLSQVHPLLIEDVYRPLAIFLKAQIAIITVAADTPKERQHAHALLLSKNRELYNSAPEAEIYLRSLRNTIITHKKAVDLREVIPNRIRYTADHMTREGSEIYTYNKSLLSNRQNPGGYPNGSDQVD